MIPTSHFSKIHIRFSELLNDPRVITHPQEFLGPNYRTVLNYWNKLDGLSEEQWRTIRGRFWDFRDNQISDWNKAIDEAIKASEETIGVKFAFNAADAARQVYGWVANRATIELIGSVENPVFLKMFEDVIENSSQ